MADITCVRMTRVVSACLRPQIMSASAQIACRSCSRCSIRVCFCHDLSCSVRSCLELAKPRSHSGYALAIEKAMGYDFHDRDLAMQEVESFPIHCNMVGGNASHALRSVPVHAGNDPG